MFEPDRHRLSRQILTFILLPLFVTIVGGIFVNRFIGEGDRYNPAIHIENKLLLPVGIIVDGDYKGNIESNASKTIASLPGL